VFEFTFMQKKNALTISCLRSLIVILAPWKNCMGLFTNPRKNEDDALFGAAVTIHATTITLIISRSAGRNKNPPSTRG
jgi:hypothetical protein